MNRFLLIFAAGAGAAIVAATPASAITVPGSTSATTDLGEFAAGDWRIVATGTVDLLGAGGLVITPDGTPAPGPQAPGYAHFYPNGTDTDAGFFGPGGGGVLLGELMGSLGPLDVPNSNHSFTPGLFGYGAVLHLPAPGRLYAMVNDTFYSNNGGSYSVQVERVVTGAIPEPATWAMMLTGFFGLGVVVRRRRAATA